MQANNPANQEMKLLLNHREAAAALGLSERTLTTITANHEIPHIRIGRCLRYPVRDLNQWISERTEGASNDE